MKKQEGFGLISILLIISALLLTAGGVIVWQKRVLPTTTSAPSPIISGGLSTDEDLPPSETFVPEFSQRQEQFTDIDEKLLFCIAVDQIRGTSPDRNSLEFIINSQEEYQSLLQFRPPVDFCQDFKLPSIDFSQFILLGKYTEGGGCSIDFVRKIYRDDVNKEVIYSIKVIEEGFCKKMGMSMNWALVPKIPSNYKVRFEVQ